MIVVKHGEVHREENNSLWERQSDNGLCAVLSQEQPRPLAELLAFKVVSYCMHTKGQRKSLYGVESASVHMLLSRNRK